MTSTITYAGGTITPELVLGYTAQRPNRNVVHDLLYTSSPGYTFRPAGYRRGTLQLFFLTFAEANACDQAHRTPQILTFATDDVAGIGMRYITRDETTIELDPESRELWTVSIPFQEVP